MTLVEIKEKCEKLLKTIEKLYAAKSTAVINKDIAEYIAKNPDRIIKEGNAYILDENIQIRIVNGNVDIIDERGSAFGWLFEIDSDVYRGDAIVINGKLEFVRSLRDETVLDVAMEVVERLEKSIQTLNSTGIENYSYYSAHEDVKVNDFEAMINIILNRKPTIF